MSSIKKLSCSSKFANGKRIREIRHRLGLTQLELAMRLDCSERLVRKMENQERVSVKSLSTLFLFLKKLNFEVELSELVFTPSNGLEVANQWFRDQFIERIEAGKWLSETLALSSSTLSKLKILEGFDEITVCTVVNNKQSVAISFAVKKRKGLSPSNPCGCVWINVEKNKITQLHLILDTRFELTGL